MIYKTKELIEKLGSEEKAYIAISKGIYKRISHGLYTDDIKENSELEQIFARYPMATLTMESAFSFYELSDYVADKYYIATPSKSHAVKDPKVVQVYMQNDLCDIGRERVKTEHGYIYVYDKERMLIELFRLKSKLSHDYFKEIVSSYRVLAQGLDLINRRKIINYCSKITYGASIRKQIEEIVL